MGSEEKREEKRSNPPKTHITAKYEALKRSDTKDHECSSSV
jgi:hypothetical protein